jgi:hypothetical protein
MSGIGWKAANINDKLARVKAKNGRSRLRSEISERINCSIAYTVLASFKMGMSGSALSGDGV